MPAKYEPKRIDPAFLAWVKGHCEIEEDGCWIWQGQAWR